MPRVKREQRFTTLLRKWIDANPSVVGSSAIEVKVTTGKSIPFSAVQDHQVRALMQSKKRSLAYKISDDSLGQKPFDLFTLQKANAFVALAFLVPRKPIKFWLLDIELFLSMQDEVGRRSVTAEILKDYQETSPELCLGFEIPSLHSRVHA